MEQGLTISNQFTLPFASIRQVAWLIAPLIVRAAFSMSVRAVDKLADDDVHSDGEYRRIPVSIDACEHLRARQGQVREKNWWRCHCTALPPNKLVLPPVIH
jgi:hypothetical protein